jgi:F0F1-type ATP synthase membrane subunit b/b'
MPEVAVNVPVLHAALVDLDATYLMQVVVFLVLYAILSLVFFRPYLRFLRRRDEATQGLRDRSRELLRRATELEENAERELTRARQAAVAERRRLADEGIRLRDETVAAERTRVQQDLDARFAELDSRRREFAVGLDRVAGDLALMIENRLQTAEGKAE